MPLEVIAVAGAWQYLTRQGKFFAVAVYLRANLTAERYVVANIGSSAVCCPVRRLLFLIPIDNGRLSNINFNRSVRVNGVGHKFRGVVGTL